MADCSKCNRTDVKCCNTCKKDAEKCNVWHNCGSDCTEHEAKAITNADRIRSMSDEELAEFLGGIDHTIDDCEFIVKIGDEWLHDSTADILDWLQSEVEGVTENE